MLKREALKQIRLIKAPRKFDVTWVTKFKKHPLGVSIRSFHSVILEIGAGRADYAWSQSLQTPDVLFLAIEKTKSKFQAFQNSLGMSLPEKPKNFIYVHANAESWVPMNLPPKSIDEIRFLYPNPHPKRPEARWYAAAWFENVLTILKPGGKVVVATNEEVYARECSQYLCQVWKLNSVQMHLIPKASTPRTLFEAKYLARGEQCFEVVGTLGLI